MLVRWLPPFNHRFLYSSFPLLLLIGVRWSGVQFSISARVSSGGKNIHSCAVLDWLARMMEIGGMLLPDVVMARLRHGEDNILLSCSLSSADSR